jgi:hypothetical protein
MILPPLSGIGTLDGVGMRAFFDVEAYALRGKPVAQNTAANVAVTAFAEPIPP